MWTGQAGHGGRAWPHHGALRHGQPAVLSDGAAVPLPLGLHRGRSRCPGQGAVPAVPLRHVGIRAVHCLDMFPERAGICVAFGAARELTHVGLLLSGE